MKILVGAWRGSPHLVYFDTKANLSLKGAPGMVRECTCILVVASCSICNMDNIIAGCSFILSANQVSSVQFPKDTVTHAFVFSL